MAVNSSTDSSSCGDGPGTQRELKSDSDIWRVSTFRTALPQVLATCAQSTLLLELGMMVGVPTIVIAALLNSETGLSMNSTQASWFGKCFSLKICTIMLSALSAKNHTNFLRVIPQLLLRKEFEKYQSTLKPPQCPNVFLGVV
ncbi:uncharacterized protein LOC124372469 [Homalodisca vitripennis]|uniref:uncharacterized protein LOC124372469 n=1 Tax=Homalodisca vitripennis TaxID=197043 RepID=UPI001EEB24B3|nr:uncharacterized protein LOC124372469 [Homalodisca vitripennis]